MLRETVTTSYDQCFELAAAASQSPPVVMPWAAPRGRNRWLPKLDGDVATARDARALWQGMPDRVPGRALRAELARHGATGS